MTSVAQLSVDFTANTSDFNRGIGQVESTLEKSAGKFSGIIDGIGAGIAQGLGIGVGLGIADVTGRVVGLGMEAVQMGIAFDQSLRNIQSITGQTNDEISALGDQLNAVGSSTFLQGGSQTVANAFYDIVGSVADVNARMPILTASIATAEAGAAGLDGVVKALTGTLNAYGSEVLSAGHASDVLTRTVGMGVGTMEELASAMPQVTGLAASMGVSFDELGGYLAYSTTKGFSFSQAATQVKAMITALINPNERLKEAFKELGFASGEAAIEQYGLIGAFEQVETTAAYAEYGLAALVGSTEALNGVITLTDDSAAGFLSDYTAGIEGATAAARDMQAQSFAAQWTLLKNEISAVGVALGTEFLPYAIQGVQVLKEFVDIGAGLLGIDLNFDVNADGLNEAITAATEMGPALPPIEMSQSVTVTLAGGDSLWSQWSQEFSDQISWEEFRSQGEQAAIAQGFPNVSSLPAGFAFHLEIEGGATVTAGATEGASEWSMTLDKLTDAMFINVEAQRRYQAEADPTAEAITTLNDAFNNATGLNADFGFPLSGLQNGYDLAVEFYNFVSGTFPGAFQNPTEALNQFTQLTTVSTKAGIDGFWGLTEKIKGADLSIQNLQSTAANFAIGAGITAFQEFLKAVNSDINAIKNNLPTIGSISIPVPPGLQGVYDMIMGAIGGLERLGIGGGTPGTNNWLGAALATLPARDSGGSGMAGNPYLIGVGAQPEVFIPSTNGTFIPNFDQYMGGGSNGGTVQQITVNATFTDANSFFDTMQAIGAQRS